jgi:hypothetical protein
MLPATRKAGDSARRRNKTTKKKLQPPLAMCQIVFADLPNETGRSKGFLSSPGLPAWAIKESSNDGLAE